MRKSFYQMLQLIEGTITNQHNLNKHNNSVVRQILNSVQDEEQRRIIAVKLALYCAEDCIHLIPEDNQLRQLAESCLNAIESWLIDPNSTQDLLSFSNAIYTSYDVTDADFVTSASHACAAAIDTIEDIDNFYVAASYASNAYYYKEDHDQNIRQEKLKEYKSYLINLVHNHQANIEFDDNSHEFFQQELLKRDNPNHWNSGYWFDFLNMLQNEYNIPIVIKYNNNYIINPNLGNYNIQNNNPIELVNHIASEKEFKDLRLKLYNKIINIL